MQDKLLAFLNDLIRLPGLSAHEGPVRERIQREWEPWVDELSLGRLGSLRGIKHGFAPSPRPAVMLAGHMDSVGLMVSQVWEGFLRVQAIGGLDPRILPGQSVMVHARRDLPGVIVQPPEAALPQKARKGAPDLKYLLVDIGLPPRQVARHVRPGDLVSFSQPPFPLNSDRLAGHSLDNRASLAALTICLQELEARRHAWDLMVVATTQEEETMVGASGSAFELRPSLAVVVDVTYGRSPGLAEHDSFPLGQGPTNGWGPNIHPGVYRELKRTAEREEIPLKDEIMPGASGTDAMALQISRQGIPTGVISIPLRYMHTPVEVVSLRDIRRAGRLLAFFVAGLEADFLEGLTWESVQ